MQVQKVRIVLKERLFYFWNENCRLQISKCFRFCQAASQPHCSLSCPPPPPPSISTPLPSYPTAPSHLPFFTSPHPLRPPSSRCTACLLSLEELMVALIWSLGVSSDCGRGSECVRAVHSWQEGLLILREESDACPHPPKIKTL